jgi:hypothetical protein
MTNGTLSNTAIDGLMAGGLSKEDLKNLVKREKEFKISAKLTNKIGGKL